MASLALVSNFLCFMMSAKALFLDDSSFVLTFASYLYKHSASASRDIICSVEEAQLL